MSARRHQPVAADPGSHPFDLGEALAVVRRRTSLVPRSALVLGSGLGVLAEGTACEAAIPYAEIPGIPRSSVVGHAGRLLLGKWAGRPVAIAQGRSHLYEGHAAEVVTRMELAPKVGVILLLGAIKAVLGRVTRGKQAS